MMRFFPKFFVFHHIKEKMTKISAHEKRIIQCLMEYSNFKNWEESKHANEFYLHDYRETRREINRPSCICGKNGLRYHMGLYKNDSPVNEYRVGRCCSKYFNQMRDFDFCKTKYALMVKYRSQYLEMGIEL